jgi:hypothetical protein
MTDLGFDRLINCTCKGKNLWRPRGERISGGTNLHRTGICGEASENFPPQRQIAEFHKSNSSHYKTNNEGVAVAAVAEVFALVSCASGECQFYTMVPTLAASLAKN